jgi:hypothetical protein
MRFKEAETTQANLGRLTVAILWAAFPRYPRRNFGCAPDGYHARWVCAAILQSDSRLLVKIPVQRNFCRVNLAVPEQAAGLQYRLSVRDRWLSGNGIVEETQ